MIGQGTWQVADAARTGKSIQVGLDLGMTHIDTAELYEVQSGSESMLGPIVHDRREEIFLASKVRPQFATAAGVVSACKDSLMRLMAEHLDLYYLHWPGSVPLEETMRGMTELLDAGWIGSIGVSNFDVAHLEEAEAILGKGVLAANQVPYHLDRRDIEAEVVPWCQKRKVAVVGYSPFGAGQMPTGARRAVLDEVARGLGKSSFQVALAFLTRLPGVFAIPKAEQEAHVRDNAGGDFDLPVEAAESLDEAFPLHGAVQAH